MLDFQKLKETITIIDVLAMLGIEHLTVRGDTLRGVCSICKHEDGRAFIVTPAKNTWYCFKEKSGGDIIRLVAKHEKVSDREAAEKISTHFSGAAPATADKPAEKPKTKGFDAKAYQQALDPDHEGLEFNGGMLRHFGGGYASKGLHRGRLVLPICHTDGSINAFVGIALKGEEPELLYPKDFRPPLYMGCEHVGAGVLYLAAHPKHMLTAYEGGLENVIALLQPISPETLVCLTALMRDRNCDTLEMI